MRLSVAALALLAGCASGVKPYPEDAARKNLRIRAEAQSVRPSLHIHSVDAQCRTQYEGSVDLDQPVSIGIPPERWTYLVFQFESSGLFSANTSMSKSTLLRPEADHTYDVRVVYKDNLYDIAIREVLPRGAQREMPLRDFSACRPRGS